MPYSVLSTQKSDYPALVDVWEASVRATHHFISEAYIQEIKPLLLEKYLDFVDLRCIRASEGQIIGFSGVANGKMEMLFIHPAWRGKGVGRVLTDEVINQQKATLVDVNEENDQAVGFYKAMGYEVYQRSPLDALGKEHPILHMRYNKTDGPLLRSERLHLVPFSRDEIVVFHQLNTNPFIRKYLWDDQLITEEQVADILQTNSKHFKDDQYGLWKLYKAENSQLIGYAGLWHFFEEAQPQLLYALLEEHTKQGFASEAAQRVVQYAFDKLRLKELTASMDEANKASQKVAQRIGMQQEKQGVFDGKPTIFFKLKK